jgi:hypothetical protein
MIASITRMQSPLSFLLIQMLIYLCCSQMSELCLIFKASIYYLHVIVLPCILVMRQCLLIGQPPYWHQLKFLYVFCSIYVISQQIPIISVSQKLMCPIQFQSHVVFLDLPNGIF